MLEQQENNNGGLNGGAAAAVAPARGKTYKIGFEGPLSGDNAQLGINEENAVKLAIEQANAKGDLRSSCSRAEVRRRRRPGQGAGRGHHRCSRTATVVGVIGPSFSGATKAVASVLRRGQTWS